MRALLTADPRVCTTVSHLRFPDRHSRRVRTLCVQLLVALGSIVIGGGLGVRSAGADCIDYGDYLHWVGGVETPVRALGVAVVGTHAYVTLGSYGLRVIDITNPESPWIVGGVNTPGVAFGVAVSGAYAYVADYGSGLQVIDISSPASPQIVGSVDTPGAAFGVAVSGTHAYVADSTGLQVIEVRVPESPEIVGSVATPWYALGVTVSGTHAYVADYGSGLQVIDISSPASPQIVGSVDTPGEAQGVAVSNDLAYVADGNSGLQVVDITHPASPWIVGRVQTRPNAAGVAVSGTYAYVAVGSGLQVIDISSPASPQIVGSVSMSWYALGVAVSDALAYVAGPGLQVIDITHPASPQIVGTADTPGIPRDVAISDTLAYVADNESGLQVIDVRNPQSPQIVGSVDTYDYINSVAISGSHAYVIEISPSLEGWLTVIDVSHPEVPQHMGWVHTPGEPSDVAVSDSFAYVADGPRGLQLIDVRNPQSPQIVGSVDTPGFAYGVAVSDTLAYVADGSQGLQLIDVRNPASPQIVGRVDTPGFAYGVAVSGTLACVADGAYGLQVIDVTNPQSPQIVGMVDIPCPATEVAVSALHAYVAAYDLWVIDISNPRNPLLLGSGPRATDMAISDDHVYVANWSLGLQIMPTQCELHVSSASPQFGTSDGPQEILVLGHGFQEGLDAGLVREGIPDIPGQNTVVQSADTLTATFDLTGQASGGRDLVVRNPDGEADTLYNAFTIVANDAVNLLTRVAENYTALQSLRCHMTVTLWQGEDTLLAQSRGLLLDKAPDRLRLETLSDDSPPQTTGIIIINDTRRILVDPETGAAVEQDLLEQTELTADQWRGFDFLRHLTEFLGSHDVEITQTYEQDGATISVIEAIPHVSNPRYTKLELHVREDRGSMPRVVLHRGDGSSATAVSLAEEEVFPNTWIATSTSMSVPGEGGVIEGTLLLTELEPNVSLPDSLFEIEERRLRGSDATGGEQEVGRPQEWPAPESPSIAPEPNALPDWSDPAVYKPNPLLLVHGFGGGRPSEWDETAASLRPHLAPYAGGASPYLVVPDLREYANASVDCDDPPGAPCWARALGDQIKLTVDELPGDAPEHRPTQSILVCHSIGGLAAREAVAEPSHGVTQKVTSIITTGTPHLGSHLALYGQASGVLVTELGTWFGRCLATGQLHAALTLEFLTLTVQALRAYSGIGCNIDPGGEATKDMALWSTFLSRLKDKETAHKSELDSIRYKCVPGEILGTPTRCPCWLPSFRVVIPGPDDGIVSVASQTGKGTCRWHLDAHHFSDCGTYPGEQQRIFPVLLLILDGKGPRVENLVGENGDCSAHAGDITYCLKGDVYDEFFPATTQVKVTWTRPSDGQTGLIIEDQVLRPHPDWRADDPDSPVARLEETFTLPEEGAYRIDVELRNPAGKKAAGFVELSTGNDLGIVGIAGNRARPGITKRVGIGYRNYSPTQVEDVSLVAQIHPQVTYRSSTPPGTFDGSTVTWDLGTLPPDATGEVSIVFAIAASTELGEQLTTTATIYPLEGDVSPSDNSASETETVVGSWDPNAKVVVPAGSGEDGFVRADQLLSYQVFFENLPSATAEAVNVVVTDTLDANLDWASLELGPVSHPGSLEYTAEEGILSWRFEGINLPPNVNPPEGEGWVTFQARPNRDLASGTAIRNSATIVFDFNPPIATPEVRNTIDAMAPVSMVAALADTQQTQAFIVSWTATDDSTGSGVRDHTIYVAADDGPFTLWLQDTPAIADTFQADLGHRYSFYCTATDSAGNEEAKDPVAEAWTLVSALPPQFRLGDAKPNPFATLTRIEYDLPYDSNVSLVVYDVTGREVKTLRRGLTSGGDNYVDWDGCGDDGRRLPAGIYVCRMRAQGFDRTIRLVWLPGKTSER